MALSSWNESISNFCFIFKTDEKYLCIAKDDGIYGLFPLETFTPCKCRGVFFKLKEVKFI